MAGSIRCLIKLNLGLLSKNVSRCIVINQARTLFTAESIGMMPYYKLRDMYKNQLTNLEDNFRRKMQSYVDDKTSGMIFTEDLKMMLHLAENTPEDKDLIVKMITKFNDQSESIRFGTFLFGPIVMRTLHRLNDPELALQLFSDPTFAAFFNQLSSYQIFMDLLYRNMMYEVMREMYDMIKTRLTEGTVHPRNALILVIAACYKANTPDSYKYAVDLWRDLDRRGYPMIRRLLTFLGALAVNQGQPHAALEILSTAQKPRHIALRCLKIMAFCDMDRLDDIIPFFRKSLQMDRPDGKRDLFFKDTIERVEAAIERNNLSPDAEIRKLVKLIKDSDGIQNKTVDNFLSEEISVIPKSFFANRGDTRGGRNSEDAYEQDKQRNHRDINTPTIIRRPGLRDLV